jgi:hypothetical protein
MTSGAIDPGKVFDLTMPLDQPVEGYAAMDERRRSRPLLRLAFCRDRHNGQRESPAPSSSRARETARGRRTLPFAL